MAARSWASLCSRLIITVDSPDTTRVMPGQRRPDVASVSSGENKAKRGRHKGNWRFRATKTWAFSRADKGCNHKGPWAHKATVAIRPTRRAMNWAMARVWPSRSTRARKQATPSAIMVSP